MKAQVVLIVVIATLACPSVSPYEDFYRKLSRDQQVQLQGIITDAYEKPRADFEEKTEKFIAALPQDLQDLANQHKAAMEGLLEKGREKAKSLSASALKVYKTLEDIRKNTKLTFAETAKKVKDVLKNGRPEVINELNQANLLPEGEVS